MNVVDSYRENPPPTPDDSPRVNDYSFFVEVENLKRVILANLKVERDPAAPVEGEDKPPEAGHLASVLFDRLRTPAAEDSLVSEEVSASPASPDGFAARIQISASNRSSAPAAPARAGPDGRPLRPGTLPVVGDEICGFKLLAELGRGAFARVFLAEQSSLGGRPVVVKVSAIQGNEPQTLAQLQHTHIVPIYSLHESEQAGLRLLCMPYFRGATLAQVLQAVWHLERRPRRGRELVQSLNALSHPHGPSSLLRQSLPALPGLQALSGRSGGTRSGLAGGDSQLESLDSGVRRRLARIGQASSPAAAGEDACPTAEGALKLLSGATFVEAAAWIAARLAEALQHAHDRGILHRDLKPSNILLTSDGQPMLLDFNLAQQTTPQGEAIGSVLGGTVAYMAPEHLTAIAAHDPALGSRVDQRADIYSLGMVLFEMLAGRRPFETHTSRSAFPALINALAVERSASVPSIRRHRSDVPWSLESIVRKCLAPLPANRYQKAEHLAEDLRRFLDHQPLKHAPELSLAERARKWTRRHPRLASWGTLAGVGVGLLALTAVIGLSSWDRMKNVEAAQIRDQFDKGVIQALCLINTQTVRLEHSDFQTLQEHVEAGVRVCEESLELYGVLDDPGWQDRASWQRLTEDERRKLASDMRELLLVLADARLYLAQSRHQSPSAAVLQECLAYLDKAELLPGLEPCGALFEQRAVYLELLSKLVGGNHLSAAHEARRLAESWPPRTAGEHYLLALSRIRANQLDKAIDYLKKSVQLDTRSYWAWFRLGLLYSEVHDYRAAIGAYDVCTALWPEFIWAYLNRAAVQAHLGRYPEAINDYTRGLAYDPEFRLLYLNRGLAYQQLDDHKSALGDLDRARGMGVSEDALFAARGKSLEALGRHAEAEEAFNHALRLVPDNHRVYLMRAFATGKRKPLEALADFDRVLAKTPGSLDALYGKGVILCDPLGKINEAIACFDQALDLDPMFVPALRGRAILKAREGRFEAALEDVERALRIEPSGMSYYTAACVQALFTQLDPSAAETAVRCLREALRRNYGRDRFKEDPDLMPVRKHPAYRELEKEFGAQQQ